MSSHSPETPDPLNANKIPAGLSPGVVPLTGRFTDDIWAEIMNVKPKTIQRWVEKYNIPHKRPGDGMLIDAVDFWDGLPYTRPQDPPPSTKRGSKKGS